MTTHFRYRASTHRRRVRNDCRSPSESRPSRRATGSPPARGQKSPRVPAANSCPARRPTKKRRAKGGGRAARVSTGFGRRGECPARLCRKVIVTTKLRFGAPAIACDSPGGSARDAGSRPTRARVPWWAGLPWCGQPSKHAIEMSFHDRAVVWLDTAPRRIYLRVDTKGLRWPGHGIRTRTP